MKLSNTYLSILFINIADWSKAFISKYLDGSLGASWQKENIVAQEKEIGKITHFFDKISVAIVELSSGLKVGDKIHVKGHTTDFELDVDSIQINKDAVQSAKSGEIIGVKVPAEAREGDKVYLG